MTTETIIRRQDESTQIMRFTYGLLYGILYFAEVLLFLRLAAKLLGANAANPIISLLYAVTLALMGPFAGMFPTAVSGTIIFEPSVLIAMIGWAVIAYVIAALLRLIEPKT
jgi:hypothetical protein